MKTKNRDKMGVKELPDPENVRLYRPGALVEASMILGKQSREELERLRNTLNNWGWNWLLGDPPRGWEELPNYRKPWMPEETRTRVEYIRPYMAILDTLGVPR